MRLLKSLGYSYPTKNSKRKKLYGVYECPECAGFVRALDTNVKSGNTTRCYACAFESRRATRTIWTASALMREARKYETRQEFKEGSPNAYSSARKQGVLSEVCGSMRCGKTIWWPEELRDEALKYSFRTDFMVGSGGAYRAALDSGVLDSICGHMRDGGRTCDNDAVYIWKATGKVKDGVQVYKVGITSQRLRSKRIASVASVSGVEYELIALAAVEDARAVEARLLALGTPAAFNKESGYTEYRAFRQSELAKALDIISAAEIAGAG